MPPDRLETLYTALAEAIGRIAPDRVPLLLATLALDLLAHHDDPDVAAATISRAERLAAT